MKSKLAIAAFLGVMGFVTYSAFAAGQTFLYYEFKMNFNDTVSYYANWAYVDDNMVAKDHEKTTMYADWSAAQKADILDKMTNLALPADHFWLLIERASTGEDRDEHRDIDQRRLDGVYYVGGVPYPHPYIPLVVHTAVFYSDVDWDDIEACDWEATLWVPWVNTVTHTNTTFWGLTELLNSAPIQGNWDTPSNGATDIKWNIAVLDKPLVTELLTNPLARGLREWGDVDSIYGHGGFNDRTNGRAQWSETFQGPARVNLLLQEALGGDANLDETCNFTDYQILERNFGRTSKNWVDADFNQDGTVDFTDYQVLERQFGQTIPEPATLALIAGGLAAAMLRRRR